MRPAGQQTWPPTSDCYFRSSYPILRQKPLPGAWLIWSGSLTRWRERYMASPQIKRSSSRWNSQSTWLSFNLSGTPSAFSCSRKPLNNAWYISDIQWCIWWALYQSQSGEWVQVTILPPIFLNRYISPMWKRHINQPTKSIVFDRCSSTMTGVPVLTIWMSLCHILLSKASTILTLQKFSTFCLILIHSKVHAEPICYVSQQLRTSPLSALYHSRYIIGEHRMSTECSVSNGSSRQQRFQPTTTVPGKSWNRNWTVAMGPTTRKPGMLQLGRFYHQKPGISTSQLWHKLSIWVLIVLWHD